MTLATIREKAIAELNLLPDTALPNAYTLLQKLRRDAEKGQQAVEKKPLAAFAGILADWSDDEFNDFVGDIYEQRKEWFQGRPEA